VTGPDDATREQPAVEPTVSTSPPPAQPVHWWSAIPTHLGKARTSTVVLGLLFLAIGALYLTVRPDVVGATTTGGDTEVTNPAPTTGGSTAPAPTATTPAPTSTEPTTPSVPTNEPLPSGTTESVPPTTETTTAPPVPTSAPTG
jgi:hypothetical protein